MFSELFDLAKSTAKTVAGNKSINLSNRRIRSISSFSSNSIFYFPVVVSDQCQSDEITMIQRALEKQYASFIVACISQIPFHRVSSGDAFAVDDYLKQFHQNLGVNPGTDAFAKAYNAASLAGVSIPIGESADGKLSVEDFFAKVWNESVTKETDYVTYLVENYISINDVFNETATDEYTKALTDRYKAVNEELDTWGFIGSIPPESITEMTDIGYEPQVDDKQTSDDPLDADAPIVDDATNDDDGYPVTESVNQIDKIKYTLESISDNKIRSCKNRSKLRSIESKLKGLKSRYTKYLIRYKKKYEENQKNGTKKKLHIRFNKTSIEDPKSFMKEYGSYMNIINRKLKLCEKRREELTTRAGQGKTVTANESVAFDMTYSEYLQNEAAMSAKVRNGLADDVFGLPEKRKYPLNDAKHVKLAIQMSGHLNDKDDLKTLAKNITKRASELNMDITVSKKNALYEYMPKALRESIEEDALSELTQLDEQALDILTEAIDSDLNSSDDEIFIMEDAADDVERLKKALGNEYKRREEAEKKYAQEKQKYDQYKEDDKKAKQILERDAKRRERLDKARPTGNINVSRRGSSARDHDYEKKTFDREIFTKMDMQKCNEMVPTFTRASIGFIVDETEEVVNRDLLVGIKAYIHRVKTSDLTSELYNAIMQKRRFLKLVKFISGEERSLSDLLFGIRELKGDALKTRNNGTRWSAMFKNRKRMSKMSIPFLMKNYLPNGTIVMTMNEVEYIKSEYGVDIMRNDHCRMVMDANFLLGFVILDQTNEIVYVMYDGLGTTFQQYSYAALEREQQNSDRAMKEMFRLMNR